MNLQRVKRLNEEMRRLLKEDMTVYNNLLYYLKNKGFQGEFSETTNNSTILSIYKNREFIGKVLIFFDEDEFKQKGDIDDVIEGKSLDTVNRSYHKPITNDLFFTADRKERDYFLQVFKEHLEDIDCDINDLDLSVCLCENNFYLYLIYDKKTKEYGIADIDKDDKYTNFLDFGTNNYRSLQQAIEGVTRWYNDGGLDGFTPFHKDFPEILSVVEDDTVFKEIDRKNAEANV